MHWLDTLMLAALALGAVLGARSGFLWQVARLAGLAAAFAAAVVLNEAATRSLQEALLRDADPRLARGMAYVVVFLFVYLFCFYAARLLAQGVQAAELQAFDRLLGAGLGAGKMALLLAGVCFALARYPHPLTADVLEKSELAPVLAGGIDHALALLPAEYRRDITDRLAGLGRSEAASDAAQTPSSALPERKGVLDPPPPATQGWTRPEYGRYEPISLTH